jgi:pimeloyl-ACP methyl ester carboxylesterase
MKSSECEITLPTGLTTPVKSDIPDECKAVVVFGHGLGVGNLKKKNHITDRWIRLASEACLRDEHVGVISYTSRGHGASTGWEETAASDKAQFTWSRLAGDMLAIADTFALPTFIAGGQSMGAATALFSAIQNPDRVRGLVLMRPPTAWALRAARKSDLLSVAHQLETNQQPGEQYHHVLLGTAEADLPPLNLLESFSSTGDTATDNTDYYSLVQCPVLILTIAGDDAHPVATAEGLRAVLKRSSLHIAEDVDTAAKTWPDLIFDFVQSIS